MAKEENSKKKPTNNKKVLRQNTRPVPVVIVLVAAATACIISILQGADFNLFFKRLLFSVIIFGIIGLIIRFILLYVLRPDEEEIVGNDAEDENADETPGEDDLREEDSSNVVPMEDDEDDTELEE